MKRLAVAIVGAFLASLLVAAPAQAEGVPVTAEDGVFYIGCRDHDFRYDVNWETQSADVSWWVTFTLTDPNGTKVTERTIVGGPKVATSWFELCDDMPPGAYTITGVAYSENHFGFTGEMDVKPTTFHMRSPESATQLAVVRTTTARRSTQPARRAVLRVRARAEAEVGYEPARRAVVRLERKKAGRWVKIRGSRERANRRGVAVIRVKVRGKRMKVRARTLGANSAWKPSTSRRVVVRR